MGKLRAAVPTGPAAGLLAVFVLFTALIAAKGELGSFLSIGNLRVLLHEATIPGVLALGMLIVIISGGIDLSIGAVMALVTVITMQVYRATDSGPLCVFSGLLTGVICGGLNGLAITRLRLPPFVATLGMMGIARGLATGLSGRRLLAFQDGDAPDWVLALARVRPKSDWLLVNPGIWSWALLAVATAVLLRATVFGRHCYAVGSSPATADASTCPAWSVRRKPSSCSSPAT